jgi:aryl-alcohol dehydrogenase-like predicted oxidoreductase
MQKIIFGKTGFLVSKLSVGTDTKISADYGGRLLKRAYEFGINFWDTDSGYGTHPAVREGLRGLNRSDIIVASKTYAKTYEIAQADLNSSLEELDTDYIDIFHLHAVDTMADFQQKQDVVQMLQEAKSKGLIKAVGVSTHTVEVTQALATVPEIDAVLTVISKTGAKIRRDGKIEDMLAAAQKLYNNGKGVYAMKPLDRDQRVGSVESYLSFLSNLPYVHSACVGMKTIEELEMNVRITNELEKNQ